MKDIKIKKFYDLFLKLKDNGYNATFSDDSYIGQQRIYINQPLNNYYLVQIGNTIRYILGHGIHMTAAQVWEDVNIRVLPSCLLILDKTTIDVVNRWVLFDRNEYNYRLTIKQLNTIVIFKYRIFWEINF